MIRLSLVLISAFAAVSSLLTCSTNQFISLRGELNSLDKKNKILIKKIIFYEDEKCLKLLEETALSQRVKNYIKSSLKEKLEKKGFIIIDNDVKEEEVYQLEIKAWRRAKFFGLINFLEAQIRIYDQPIETEKMDKWLFEILVSHSINSTDEKVVKKVIDNLLDQFIETLEKNFKNLEP